MTTDDHLGATGQVPAHRIGLIKPLALLVAVLVAGVLIAGFAVWPLSPDELSHKSQAENSNLYAQWQAGNVVVLVRHAERCDRTQGACAEADEGITPAGQQVAKQVGAAFMTLGMTHTDVLSSPLTRTEQTAQAMFDVASTRQDWLLDCHSNMGADIKAHKVAGRNLMLVTHSGCISKIDTLMGFPHARTAEYASSLFVTFGANGKLKVLGVVNAQDWQKMSFKDAAL